MPASSLGQFSAPVAPLTLVGPGFLGMNTQLSSTTLGPEWAIEAKNCVFDDANRLSARLGWTALTSSAATGSPVFRNIFEYVNLSGTSVIVSAGGNKFWAGTTTLTDVTGAVVVTADKWKFVNFNGNCYGLQASHALVQYTGAGNFTNVAAASGTVPDGNELLSAFGRLWGTSANGQKLKYSGLLDATNWGGAGAGSFDFTNVWATPDSIVALAAFNNYLVIFGSNNILILTDGTGSSIGINPTNAFIQDVIPGIGCTARDTVQNVNGEDLVFLSQGGLCSLRRVIIERSSPLRELSKNVRNYLLNTIAQETLADLKSTYNNFYGFYLLLCPVTGRKFVFDSKFDIPEAQEINTQTSAGAWRVTEWDGFAFTALVTLKDGKTMYSGKAGKLYTYDTGYTDAGSTYAFTYNSGWLTINEQLKDHFKFLKRLSCICTAANSTIVTLQWGFDFSDTLSSSQKTISNSGTGMEWGTGEWGIDEWGPPSSPLAAFELPATGSGQFIKVGLQMTVNGASFALQQLQLFAKVGRIK
jgi:hypothetical protein